MDANADQARLDQLKLQKDIEQYNFLKDASPVAAKRMLDENPTLKDKVTPAAPVVATPKPEVKPPVAQAKEGTAGTVASEVKKEKTLADYLAERKALGPKGQVGEEFEKYLTERLGKQTERSAAEERERRAKFFLEMGGDPMGYLSGARKGAMGYIADTAAGRKAQDAMEGEAQKARMELDKARRAEERGDIAGAQEARDKATDHDLKRQQIQASYATAGQAGRFEKESVERVMAENPGMKFADALQIVKGAGRFESTEIQRAKAALEQINNALLFMKKDDPRRAELEAQRQQIIGTLTPGGGIGGGQGGGVPQGVTVKKVG
jgi:hypothetical protein